MHRPPDPRGVFCNRTLNLRGIKAIGYDMDYTLVHYRMEGWEQRAYDYIKQGLLAAGWPVGDLTFDPDLAARGLMIDLELGNLVKANRFGYVKRAAHGTSPLTWEAQRRAYSRTLVDLRQDRWVFLNTLFSISEACFFSQLVELYDAGEFEAAYTYRDLYKIVRRTLDGAHAEGKLKAEIIADPDAFVDLDPEMPLALLDQKRAGKQLLMITNSEWSYAAPMLHFAVDRFLPGDMTWRDLFEVSLFAARKPDFFSTSTAAYAVVDDSGLLREHRGPLGHGGCYVGGNAALVEDSLGLEGGEILYVGDHIFVDVNVAKSVLRWRTCLVMRELEEEVEAIAAFDAQQAALSEMMQEKQDLEYAYSTLRLALQRLRHGYGPKDGRGQAEIEAEVQGVREALLALDARIAPTAEAFGRLRSPRWGLLMRAGNDKSHLARQVERYADIYTSRVSNFERLTPFEYLRSPRGSLPHDPA